MPPDVTQPQPPAPAEVPRNPEPQAPAVAAPASAPEPAPAPELNPAPPPPPPPPPADSRTGLTKRETSRLHRLLVVGGTLLALFVIWEVVTAYVVYTDDAYVRSDLVALAPEITGRIIAVHVVDNQAVKKGDKLVTIDPVPFQLVVNQTKAQIEQAKALLKSSQEELSTAQAALAASTSANLYAAQEQARYADLAKNEYAPRAELDRANDELRRSQAEMTISQIAISKAQTSIVAHQAALEVAIAENATAEWKLDRTQVFAPVNGTITNLTLQPGDTANIDVPMIGIVDADAWRIMANYKQYYIRDFKVGQTAWVWLDSDPWHWHRAKITGIARGISRNPAPDMLLPYVAPTTDWIRLQRRIPVTMVLVDKPDEFKLYMGADARTVIFP